MAGVSGHDEMRAEGAKAPAFYVLILFLADLLGVLVAKPARAATFTSNSTGCAGDQSPNGSCDTGVRIPDPADGFGLLPECTIRVSLQENNANDNGLTVADTINFNIGGSGVRPIFLVTALATIFEAVGIHCYSQPGARENTSTTGTNALEAGR